MSRGDFYNAGSLFHIGVFVADDWDFLVQKRQDYVAAVEVLVPFVLGVDSNGGIAEHSLGTGCRELEVFAGLLDLIEQVPEMTLLLLVINLRVRDRGAAMRTPVNHSVAAVDFLVVIKADKNLVDRFGAALVHSEPLAVPVAGRAELFELFGDSSAVLALPFPRALEEFFASEVLLGDALLAHSLDNLSLGCD